MDSKLQQEREVNGGTPFAEALGSAYRILTEGETIRESDEFLDDGGVWRKTTCAGQEAPNPAYTSHRQYRRRVDTPNDKAEPLPPDGGVAGTENYE